MPPGPRHTLNGLASRMAVLEARLDGLATKSDVKEILDEMLRQQRRHFWQMMAAVVPITLTCAAAVAEIVRVIALGKL